MIEFIEAVLAAQKEGNRKLKYFATANEARVMSMGMTLNVSSTISCYLVAGEGWSEWLEIKVASSGGVRDRSGCDTDVVLSNSS